MADEKNPLDPAQDLAAQDAAFREQMAGSDDPQDKRWRQYDNAARAQERQIGELSGVAKLYDGLTQARAERDSFREDNERTPANAQGWDEKYQGLDQAVVDHQKEFQDGLKAASLDDIQSLQGDIARRQEELELTIAARQGIAMLPSEQAAQQAQGQQQGRTEEVAVSMPNQEQWRAMRKEEQAHEDGASSRTQWSAYATSAEEAEANRRLEEDQNHLTRQLGHRPTSQEVEAYQAERDASAAHTEDHAHESETEGLRTGQSRTQGDERGQGQGAEQPAQASQPERYTLGLGQVRRQGQQAQADAGPQPNSTYSQRRAQANQAAQGQEGGETVVDAEGLQQKRARRMAQGQGM